MVSMLLELVVATKNKKKLEEIREILSDMPVTISSLADYSQAPRIIENGKTFRANAIKKAQRTGQALRKLTLGEDSGLCVNALGGRPGVYSSRFSGKGKNDTGNNNKVLRLLEGVPLRERRAHYTCAVALADAKGLVGVTEGKCYGMIGLEPRGHAGFGYDPLFIVPACKKTFAELGVAVKHTMSHRYRALVKAKVMIQRYIERKK
jgi:XTP/dITP diphosphohydrolase